MSRRPNAGRLGGLRHVCAPIAGGFAVWTIRAAIPGSIAASRNRTGSATLRIRLEAIIGSDAAQPRGARADGDVEMAQILAVDDSPSMRALVAATLQSAGHQVTSACDGVEALGLAQEQQVELVLADVNMPNMDGITLVRKLRGLPAYKFVPILMLTTEISPERKAEAKTAGATGWLVKPFEPTQLLDTIKRVIS